MSDIGGFYLGNQSSDSLCMNVSRVFEGIEDTGLTGKTYRNNKCPYHHCTHLVAVQLS